MYGSKIISVTRGVGNWGWVGLEFPDQKRYVALELALPYPVLFTRRVTRHRLESLIWTSCNWTRLGIAVTRTRGRDSLDIP